MIRSSRHFIGVVARACAQRMEFGMLRGRGCHCRVRRAALDWQSQRPRALRMWLTYRVLGVSTTLLMAMYLVHGQGKSQVDSTYNIIHDCDLDVLCRLLSKCI